jgi:hypothetical protein
MRTVNEDESCLAAMVRPIERRRVAEKLFDPARRTRQRLSALPEPHTRKRFLDESFFANFQLESRRLMRRQIERKDRATGGRIERQIDRRTTIKCSNLHDLGPGRAPGCSLRQDCKFTEVHVTATFAGFRQRDFSPLEDVPQSDLRKAGRLYVPTFASQNPTTLAP